MNSVEGYRGFITFLILSGIVLTTFIGFKIISQPTNIVSRASVKEVVPVAITDADTTDVSTSIKWSTEVSTVGGLKYSTEEELCENGDASKCNELSDAESTAEHSIDINNLSPETKYFYKVKNGSKYYPEGPALTFTTQKKKEVLNNESNSADPIKKDEEMVPENTKKEPETTTDDFDGFGTQTTFSTDNVTPEIFNDKSTTTETTSGSDYDGFGTANPGDSTVLGINTNVIEQQVTSEFDEAMKNSDLKYDFNKDGKVNNLDYPLFIEFINNRED